jgi:hypothetical protein
MKGDMARKMWAVMVDSADDELERSTWRSYSKRLSGSVLWPFEEFGSSQFGCRLLRRLLHEVRLGVWSLAMSVKCWSLLLNGCGAKD